MCWRMPKSGRHQGFSNWPTIPQLYVKGEFVGGSDIVREMFEEDELGRSSPSAALRWKTSDLRPSGLVALAPQDDVSTAGVMLRRAP